ncbi:MAG: hypothetical protein J6Y29_00730 [Clostridiales bacterium]|nr:hypothetical protein [Clostridiales bacterium]
MGMLDFLPFGKKKVSEEEVMKATVQNWQPVKDIKEGIVILKNGGYVKIVEVIPINFKLKSAADKRFLILNYRAFLKGCRFPMQMSVQCRKADIDPHLNRIKALYKMEKNEDVKDLTKGYMKLVKSLNYGTKTAISRRFFLIFPYVTPPGKKDEPFQEVVKQLKDKESKIKGFLEQCGNEIVEVTDENEFVANILYTYLNKKTSELQKFSGKLLSLKGLFVSSDLDAVGEDTEDEGSDEE